MERLAGIVEGPAPLALAVESGATRVAGDVLVDAVTAVELQGGLGRRVLGDVAAADEVDVVVVARR